MWPKHPGIGASGLSERKGKIIGCATQSQIASSLAVLMFTAQHSAQLMLLPDSCNAVPSVVHCAVHAADDADPLGGAAVPQCRRQRGSALLIRNCAAVVKGLDQHALQRKTTLTAHVT